MEGDDSVFAVLIRQNGTGVDVTVINVKKSQLLPRLFKIVGINFAVVIFRNYFGESLVGKNVVTDKAELLNRAVKGP